jgi:hypothetical protein
VWIGGILAAVVVVGVIAAAVFRNRSQDDVHSVEHYHRQLHTLEEMRTHAPTGSDGITENGHDEAAYPASSFRVSSSSAVRLTDPGHTIVPPVPPPPVKNQGEPMLFVDSHASSDPNESKSTFMSGVDDKAMHSINHRPKRLGALAAMAAVIVLIVVLVVAGMHTNTPASKHQTRGTATTTPTRSHPHSGTAAGSGHQTGRKSTSTTTTVAPVVSAPAPTSPYEANYALGVTDYSLVLSATSSDCWVSATNTSTGAVLFTGVLSAGGSHAVAAAGPVTVVAGAPAAFAATVNGAAVQLPFGFQAPFTLKFATPGASGAPSASTTTTT